MARVNMDTLEVIVESVNKKAEQDEDIPHVTHVTVLEEEDTHTTIVADYNNKCVKAFHTKNNKTSQSRLQLNALPWGIEPLGDNKWMVTVPDSNQIVSLEVSRDLIHLGHFTTRRRYYSLAYMGSSRLAAGAVDRVDILDMQGEVVQTFTSHGRRKLFSCPWFMCVSNEGHLLVSDWKIKTVTCVTSEGQLVWKYKDKSEGKLSGITTTVGGHILVADYDLRKVLQLSERGKYVREILTSQDGLRFPLGICVDKNGSLFICDKGELKKFDYQ